MYSNKRVDTFIQSFKYNRHFEFNRNADVARDEIEFDTPGINVFN